MCGWCTFFGQELIVFLGHQAKQEVVTLFEALDQEAKDVLLKGGASHKKKEKTEGTIKAQDKRESSVPKTDVGQNGVTAVFLLSNFYVQIP
jgi:hypothetical protein